MKHNYQICDDKLVCTTCGFWVHLLRDLERDASAKIYDPQSKTWVKDPYWNEEECNA